MRKYLLLSSALVLAFTLAPLTSRADTKQAPGATKLIASDREGDDETKPATPPPSDTPAVASTREEPGDWYVLHAGLRPQLRTFGGIATFALAKGQVQN